jgi:hypothetical protein
VGLFEAWQRGWLKGYNYEPNEPKAGFIEALKNPRLFTGIFSVSMYSGLVPRV